MIKFLTSIFMLLMLHMSGFSLTGGPLMPEYLQFEPAEGLDLVNLRTGDFVYTIPIMAVPGPGGSFPVTLAYHGGIRHEQPSTWCGLGWNINAGAINRKTRGMPDDYFNALLYSDIYEYHTANEDDNTFKLLIFERTLVNNSWDSEQGWSVTIGGFGFSHDTKGTSYLNLGTKYDMNSSPSGAGSVDIFQPNPGSDGWGGNQRSEGDNTNSMDLYRNNRSKPDLSLLEYSRGWTQENQNWFTSYEEDKKVVWTLCDETTRYLNRSVTSKNWTWGINCELLQWQNGYLYQGGEANYLKSLTGGLHKEIPHSIKDLGKRLECIQNNNYIFTSEDVYSCEAGNIGGTFMPIMLKQGEYRSNKLTSEIGLYLTENSTPLNVANKLIVPEQPNTVGPDCIYKASDIQFRFLSDLGKNAIGEGAAIWPYYGGDLISIDKKTTGLYTSNGIGSRIVEPILNNATGLLVGFRIIDNDGKIYEFMQPLYSLFQGAHATNKSIGIDPIVRSLLRDYTRHAYAWLLTTLKTPDYIDANANGIADNGDYGFWVRLKYTTPYPYKWRSPYQTDMNSWVAKGKYSASYGVKEIAYLNEIETATHKALFQLSDKKDGKGSPEVYTIGDIPIPVNPPPASPEFFTPSTIKSDYIQRVDPVVGDLVWIALPGVYPDAIEKARTIGSNIALLAFYNSSGTLMGNIGITSAIIGNCDNYETISNGVRAKISLNCIAPSGWSSIRQITVLGTTLALSSNINTAISTLKKLDRVMLYKNEDLVNPIRSTKFTYDYSLCSGNPNSDAVIADGATGGKLTLKSVLFEGKDGVALPPYLFNYQSGSTGNPSYAGINGFDMWGLYCPTATETEHQTKQDNNGNNGIAWNLNGISIPTGGSIKVEYERDTYFGSTTDRVSSLNLPAPTGSFFKYWHQQRRTEPFLCKWDETTNTRIPNSDYVDANSGFFEIHWNNQGEVTDIKPGMIVFVHLPPILNEQILDYWNCEPDHRPNSPYFSGVNDDYISGPYTIAEVRNLNATDRTIEVRLNTNDHWIIRTSQFSPRPFYKADFKLYVLNEKFNFYGGDLRVKQITYSNGLQQDVGLRFNYNEQNGKSSGRIFHSPATANEPLLFGMKYRAYQSSIGSGNSVEEYDKRFIGIGNETFRENILAPTPIITYGSVSIERISDVGSSVAGKNIFTFYTAADHVKDLLGNSVPLFTTAASDKKLDINDYSAFVGMPKKLVTFSSTNKEIKSIQYEYYYSEDPPPTVSKSGYDLRVVPLGMVSQSHRFNAHYDESPTDFYTIRHFRNAVYPKTVIIKKDGLTTRERIMTFDTYTGIPVETRYDQVVAIGQSATSPTVEKIVAPAHWQYQGLEEKNMLKQVFQSTTIYAFANPQIVSLVSTWSNTIGVNPNQWYKYENLIHNSNTPNIEFLNGVPSVPDEWNKTNWISKYDQYGRVVTMHSPAGVATSNISGYNARFPISRIINANVQESGVLTGDYDNNENGIYFDKANGWGHGKYNEYNNNVAIVKLDATRPHFGTNSVYVENAYGPTRGFKLVQGRNYIMSAWVYVESGSFAIDGNYRRLEVAPTNDTRNDSWPLQLPTETSEFHEFSTKPTTQITFNDNKWHKVEFLIPAKSDLDGEWVKGGKTYNWYAALYIGSPAASKPCKIYLDDIRFYPKDALVTTTYYDQNLGLPILSVDANNNPGQKIVYDGFGRPKEWYKIDKSNPTSTTLVMKKEYHLMGPGPYSPTNTKFIMNYPSITFSWDGGYFSSSVNVKYTVKATRFAGGDGGFQGTITVPGSQKQVSLTIASPTYPGSGWYIWTVTAEAADGSAIVTGQGEMGFVVTSAQYNN